MAWDAGSRLKLKQLQEVGVVAVRYKAEGCNVELEVLSCVGKGVEYRFSSYSATDQKIAKSQRDLFTELPVGAARLGGKVGAGRALRTDYMLAGVLATPVMKAFPADKLEGDCDRATHVVGSMYVGGFAMATGASERLAVAATVFGVGAGADQQRSVERLAIEGDAAACARAQRQGTREPACNVPLRIGLTPVEGRAAGSCPTGSDWNGSACVQKKVITQVECPSGTDLRGSACVAKVDTTCPVGTRFEAGKGCVADSVHTAPVRFMHAGEYLGVSTGPSGATDELARVRIGIDSSGASIAFNDGSVLNKCNFQIQPSGDTALFVADQQCGHPTLSDGTVTIEGKKLLVTANLRCKQPNVCNWGVGQYRFVGKRRGLDFEKAFAQAAMKRKSRQVEGCLTKGDKPVRTRADVTFLPGGEVESIALNPAPKSEIADCVRDRLKGVRVPEFVGRPQAVSRWYTISRWGCGCVSGDLQCAMKCGERPKICVS